MQISRKFLFTLLPVLLFSFLQSCQKEDLAENAAAPGAKLGPVIVDTLQPYFPGLDHTVAYFYLANQQPAPEVLSLKDQFSPAFKRATLAGMYYFANVIDKNNEGIIDSNAHWTWYLIDQNVWEPTRQVVIQNQFTTGTDTILIGQPKFLLTPAEKDNKGNQNKDHYKCYEIQNGKTLNIKAGIVDLCYGPDSVDVKEEVLFCPPCAKKRKGLPLEPIINPVDHVMIYSVGPPFIVNDNILSTDQFIETRGLVQDREFLTVPTKKISYRVTDL